MGRHWTRRLCGIRRWADLALSGIPKSELWRCIWNSPNTFRWSITMREPSVCSLEEVRRWPRVEGWTEASGNSSIQRERRGALRMRSAEKRQSERYHEHDIRVQFHLDGTDQFCKYTREVECMRNVQPLVICLPGRLPMNHVRVKLLFHVDQEEEFREKITKRGTFKGSETTWPFGGEGSIWGKLVFLSWPNQSKLFHF